MAIKPVNLPAGAGIDYGGGDVRHFGLGDAVNVPGLSNPTRNLAERDNLLAEKLNEVVGVVNNREQLVPLPVIRTMVPPNEELIITNYRIPAGFEARVLNAAISTTTNSTSIELDVYYSSSFGGSTGTAVVTATPGSEFTGEVSFHPAGEFIVALKNTGAVSLEVAASLMVTMRPLGATGSLLVGSVTEGQPGVPGPAGPPGPPGESGSSGASSAGMYWKNAWTLGNSYNVNDVASFSYSGTNGSYIARVGHVASNANRPDVDPVTWNTVALGVSSSGTTVNVITTSGSIPNYQAHTVFGTLTTGADWVNSPLNGFYSQTFAANTVYNKIPVSEVLIKSATANPGYGAGIAFLIDQLPVYFTGNGTFTLPKQAYGAALDYTNAKINASVVTCGTIPYTGSPLQEVTVMPVSTDSFVIKNMNPAQLAVQISIFGAVQL